MSLRLTKIKIKNFRGIRDGVLDGLTDLNIFVGRNNSGKSTILDAILLPALAVSHVDPVGQSRSDQVSRRRNESVPSPWWWYQRDQNATIEVSLHAGDRMTAWRVDRNSSSWEGSKDLKPTYLSRVVLFDAAQAARAKLELSVWDTIFAKRGDKELVASLNEIFYLQAESLSYSPGQDILVAMPSEAVRIDSLGDGARAGFRILTVLAVLRDSALLLEEPECYQHPEALRLLAQAVCRGAKDSNVQLFVTTHSRECVRYLLDAADAHKLRATVFHTTLKAGALETRNLPAETARTVLELGTDIRFLDLYA